MLEPILKHPLSNDLLLQQLFAQCFFASHHTQLQGGAEEPFYQAAQYGGSACVHYRADYAASALHEVAHWCIAGEHRRQQDDYGYWYAPDGRDAIGQQAFEKVELKPQALEMLFTVACGWRFRVSVDNLALPDYDSGPFAKQVLATALNWYQAGLPTRAQRFVGALEQCFEQQLAPTETLLRQQLLACQIT